MRDLGARVPFPLTPAQATRRAARFLDRLVASALPEAMKQAREGGWTARGFELWRDRLMRVSLICENEVLIGDQEGRAEDAREARRILAGDDTLGSGFTRPLRASLAGSVSRIRSEAADAPRDRASSRRSTLAALGVSPPRAPRERRGGGAPAGLGGERTEARRRAEDVGREVAEALRASGLTRGSDDASATAERLAALRQDENYQALVTLYRDRMRTGQMPRGVYSGPGRDASRLLEQTREDPERDALIAATVNNMMRRVHVVTGRDVQTLAASLPGGPETREERERESFLLLSEGSPSFLSREDARFETPDGSPRSLLPRAPENEDANEDAQFDATRSSLDETDPESEDAFTAGGEPPRAARVLRTLEDAEHFFATLPPGAAGHLLVPGTSGASGERSRRARASRVADATREIPPSDDGDVSSDPDEDSPNPRRVGDVLRNVATGDAGGAPGPECPPRERVDAARDEAVVVDGAPVMCPAQFAEALTAARRAVADADAAAENARDAVTCQICYVQRRDALVMPCCHLLYCYRCVTRASEAAEAQGHPDRCPCCRGPISGVLRCKLTE